MELETVSLIIYKIVNRVVTLLEKGKPFGGEFSLLSFLFSQSNCSFYSINFWVPNTVHEIETKQFFIEVCAS